MTKPRAYEISPEDQGEGKSHYGIQARHRLCLMGVECSLCGAWGTTGIQYPSVDASILEDIIPRHHIHGSKNYAPMTIKEFSNLQAKLAPILGRDRPLIPGTHFGPLEGKGYGNFPDFVWPDPWTLLVSNTVLSDMCEAGLEVVAVKANIEFTMDQPQPLFELEARPTVMIHPSPPIGVCKLCGRVKSMRGRKFDASSFNDAVPLQRVLEWPTRLIINESFANFITDRDLVGTEFKSIEWT